MSNIFSRNVDGTIVTFDSEEKNQLGEKAVVRDVKRAMLPGKVYKLTPTGAGDIVAIVMLNDIQLEKVGEPASLATSKNLKLLTNGVYLAHAESGTWSELEEAEVVLTGDKGTLKLPVAEFTFAENV